MQVRIDEIKIGKRTRKHLGNIDELAKSIEEIGLLHPVVIDKEYKLITGQRRIEAHKLLGLDKIECRIVSNLTEAYNLIKAERDENICRADFTPTEAIALAERLEPFERKAAAERMKAGTNQHTEPSDKLPEGSKGETRNKVAAAVGLSAGTIKKVKEVMAAAKEEPELFGSLVEQMDETGNVDKAYKELQKKKREKMHESKRQAELPKGKYSVIYADPPWEYRNSGFDESADNQYPTMPLDEICALPISDLADNTSILFLWATNPLLPDALKVIEAWGFEYMTNMAWIKDKGRGKGWFLKSKHELLLIAVKKNTPHPQERPDSCFEAERGTVHSKKPEMVYEIIESMYPGNKIELFARNSRIGWESWGNEL